MTASDRAAIIVLANQDEANATSTIVRRIADLLFAEDDALDATMLARVSDLLHERARGRIDRSLLTADAQFYFSDAEADLQEPSRRPDDADLPGERAQGDAGGRHPGGRRLHARADHRQRRVATGRIPAAGPGSGDCGTEPLRGAGGRRPRHLLVQAARSVSGASSGSASHSRPSSGAAVAGPAGDASGAGAALATAGGESSGTYVKRLMRPPIAPATTRTAAMVTAGTRSV